MITSWWCRFDCLVALTVEVLVGNCDKEVCERKGVRERLEYRCYTPSTGHGRRFQSCALPRLMFCEQSYLDLELPVSPKACAVTAWRVTLVAWGVLHDSYATEHKMDNDKEAMGGCCQKRRCCSSYIVFLCALVVPE